MDECEESVTIGVTVGNNNLHPLARFASIGLYDIHSLAGYLAGCHLCHLQREYIHKCKPLKIITQHEAHAEEGIALDVGEHGSLPFAVLP